MKKYITLLFLLLMTINYLLGQEKCIIEKYKSEPFDFIIGDNVTFQANHIMKGNDTIYRLDSKHYSINIEGVYIFNPDISANNKGIVVRFIVPDSNILIGDKYLYFLYKDESAGDIIVGESKIIIKGKTPSDFVPEVGVILYKGDEYQKIEIKGRNLTSVIGVIDPNRDILFKPYENYKIIDNQRLEINAKAAPGSLNKESIDLTFTYKSPFDNNTPLTKTERFIIGISEKGYKDIPKISESSYFLEDLQSNNKLEFTVFLDNYFKSNNNYHFESKDLSFDENSLRKDVFPETKSIRISLYIDLGKLAAGRKQFQIVDKTSQEVYYGYITILQDPIIKTVYDYSRSPLTYTQYETATFDIEGINLAQSTFEIIGNQDSSITIIQKPINDNHISVTLHFDENRTKITSYRFRLSREKTINGKPQTFTTPIWPENIIITEPREIAELDDMIVYEVGGVNYNANEQIPNPIPVNKGEEINLSISGNEIEDSKGPQAITLKATLISEDGKIIESINYKNPKSDEKYVLIETKTKHYDRSERSINWPKITHEFESASNIRPWSKVKLEVIHDNEYYKSLNEYPDNRSQEFILKGSTWDNFNSTITIPPTLLVWGQKKVEGKYQWKAQILPLNVGYGVQYQFRNKKTYEKIPFSLGAYLIGLNYLQIDDQDTTTIVSTEISDSTTITKTTVINNNLIEKGAVSFVLLAEAYMFNKEARVQLPFQLGMGWTIPLNGKKSQWFGVVGLGISYKF